MTILGVALAWVLSKTKPDRCICAGSWLRKGSQGAGGETREQNREGEKSIERWTLNQSPLCSMPWDILRKLQSPKKWKGVANVHELLSPVSLYFQRSSGEGSKVGRAKGCCHLEPTQSWLKPAQSGCHIRAGRKEGLRRSEAVAKTTLLREHCLWR